MTKKKYAISDVLPDGWIFLGDSPDTGKPYSLEPLKGSIGYAATWYEGQGHAVNLSKKGHLNARQPSEKDSVTSELFDIFNKIVEGGHNDVAGLDTSDSYPNGRYWASTEPQGSREKAQVRYFSAAGRRKLPYKCNNARVRCVRDEPSL